MIPRNGPPKELSKEEQDIMEFTIDILMPGCWVEYKKFGTCFSYDFSVVPLSIHVPLQRLAHVRPRRRSAIRRSARNRPKL
jgi:hypothetical protein